MKPCKYFGSSTGCSKGRKCPFSHVKPTKPICSAFFSPLGLFSIKITFRMSFSSQVISLFNNKKSCKFSHENVYKTFDERDPNKVLIDEKNLIFISVKMKERIDTQIKYKAVNFSRKKILYSLIKKLVSL
jgi:hypothetical protein